MALSKIDVANMLTGATPVANGGTAATTLAAAGLGKRPNAKPIFYNGNMAISQRATSATGKTGDGYHAVDRMNMLVTNCGTYTVAQEALTSGNAFANGFANAFRIDTTTADASPASGDILAVQQIFEGQNVQMFKKGTANAEKFTLAFWVKSNKTGNGQVNLFDNDTSGNRIVGATYSISSADTWEHKVVNFPADTTGPLDDDNAKSFIVEWWLDSGTDYSSGAVPSAWEARSNTDRNAGGALQIARNTDNDWAITGVQLEVGEFSSTTLPPFQHENFGANLERCERYYQVVGSGTRADNLTYFSAYNHDGTSTMFGIFNFRTTMRTGPSIDQTSGTDYYTFKCNNATDDFDGVNGFRGGIHAGEFYLSGGSSVGSSSAGEAGKVMGKDASAHIALAAEL